MRSLRSNSEFYLEEYPSVKEAGVNPYANYEAFGTDGDRYPNLVFKTFGESNGALVASADLTSSQFSDFQDQVELLGSEEGTEVAQTGIIETAVVFYILATGAIAVTALTYEAIRNAQNLEEAIGDAQIYTTPLGSEADSGSTNTGGETSSEDEVTTTIPGFDLSAATEIDPKSLPQGNEFLDDILNGQFEFPNTEEGGSYFLSSTTDGQNWSGQYLTGEKSNSNISFGSPTLMDDQVEKEIRSDVIDSVNTQPGAVPNRQRKNFERGGGNVGYANYNIDGETGEVKSFSGKSNLEGYAEYIPNEQRNLEASQVKERIADGDTEAKILEQIYNDTTAESSGTIRLYTKNPACSSCGKVIENFVKQRPGIEIKVVEGL